MNIDQEKVEKEYAAGRGAALTRMLPLAGVLYAFLTIAGYSTIGEFPDASTPPSGLAAFYRDHHANVVTGGRLLEWSAVCFGLFAVGLAARVQRSSTVIASLVLVGAAVDTVADGFSGAVYTFLGGVGGDGHLSPSALQAVHAWGAEFGMGAGIVVFAIGRRGRHRAHSRDPRVARLVRRGARRRAADLDRLLRLAVVPRVGRCSRHRTGSAPHGRRSPRCEAADRRARVSRSVRAGATRPFPDRRARTLRSSAARDTADHPYRSGAEARDRLSAHSWRAPHPATSRLTFTSGRRRGQVSN